MIIHLNGWPGVGKKTIGEALAHRIGARFIHNHLLHDVAIACAGLQTEARWTLYGKVRQAAYELLAARPRSEVFVMTNALCRNSAREQRAWEHVVELAMVRQVPLVPIVLQAELAENLRRVQSAERVGKKLTDPHTLEGYLAMDTIQCPDVPEFLLLDVTRLSAEAAAEQIIAHIEAIRSDLSPATGQHLRMC
jgi:gluconate kinase